MQTRAIVIATAVLAVALPASPATTQKRPAQKKSGKPSPQSAARSDFPDVKLSVALVGLDGFEETTVKDSQVRRIWNGKIGKSAVRIRLAFYPRKDFGLNEPEDVLELIEDNLRRPKDSHFQFRERSLVRGPYGALPYADFGVSQTRSGTSVQAETYWFASVLEETGYSLQLDIRPAADAAARTRILDFFKKGVRARCKKDKVAWSKAEVAKRWAEFTPDKIHKKMKVIRTKHYVIMTNSSGGKLFAKKMEEYYKKIRKLYPFAEIAGRKLMPVFLFRSADEYYAYYSKIAQISEAQAKRSKGHAWKDYYATYYESPNDPVHIHEATHQIFANRLRLSGGGSWFQEGLAEYIERLYRGYNEMKAYARHAARKESYLPFAEFFKVPSLIAAGRTKTGESGAQNQYMQAASLIAFLAESKFGKKKFQDFVHAVGAVPRGDVKAIEAALRQVYGVGIDGLEQRWVKHWSK